MTELQIRGQGNLLNFTMFIASLNTNNMCISRAGSLIAIMQFSLSSS